MYRAYIKNLEDLELAYAEIPHKGHFIYGNLIEGGNLNNTDEIVGNLIEVTDEYISPEWWCSIEKGSAEEFTRLIDSKGNKVYEGDIVKVTSQYWGQLGNKYEVKFKKGEFCVGYELLSEISPSLSVIGNVHENLELLKGGARMKLFCRHHFIEIGNFKVHHWGVDITDLDEDWDEEFVRIMCDKCGKYKEVSSWDWKIINKRQELLEAYHD
mgnify:CR=1 FL=1